MPSDDSQISAQFRHVAKKTSNLFAASYQYSSNISGSSVATLQNIANEHQIKVFSSK